jgi:hypothetical protein
MYGMKLSDGICCQDMESSENSAIAHGKSDTAKQGKYIPMRVAGEEEYADKGRKDNGVAVAEVQHDGNNSG